MSGVPDLALQAYQEYRDYHEELLQLIFGDDYENVLGLNEPMYDEEGNQVKRVHPQTAMLRRMKELLGESLQYSQLKEALVGDSDYTHEELIERALHLVDEGRRD